MYPLLKQKKEPGWTGGQLSREAAKAIVLPCRTRQPSTKPFSPNRFKTRLPGSIAGLAMGLVVAGGAEFLDDRVYDKAVFKQIAFRPEV